MNMKVEGLEAARFEMMAKKVRIISKRSKTTSALLSDHIEECSRLQKWVLRVGAVTLLWLVTHSPEAAAAFAEVMKALTKS